MNTVLHGLPVLISRHLKELRYLQYAALFLFVVACIFDPADYLGAKVPIFALTWVVSIPILIFPKNRLHIQSDILTYTILFILLPFFSLAMFYIINDRVPVKSFNLVKAYLMISLAPLLVFTQINLMPILARTLSILAVCIIATFIFLQINPDFFITLHNFGKETGIVLPDRRNYGGGIVLLQIYFVTSPMLAFSIAYYFFSARKPAPANERILSWSLFALGLIAMILAGSRNNILIAVLLPLALFFVVSKQKLLPSIIIGIFSLIFIVVFRNELGALLSPTEYSNAIKFQLLKDYFRIFSDPYTFFFGQGLGSYEYWGAKGKHFYISELTYLEMFRNFGLLGGLLMSGLLLFPVWHAFYHRHSGLPKTIAMGYLSYLAMCATNPNLFNSMGILILSVILAAIFGPEHDLKTPALEQFYDQV